MQIGLQIPDFTYPGGPTTLAADLAGIAGTADEAGFEFVAVMDHFFQISHVGPAEHDMLEAYTTLGYLAAHTERAKLLTVMTGAFHRHPSILAKMVTTLDVLSGGRAWLGIGAGWYEQECLALGIPFPPVAERFRQLDETLRICAAMWSDDEDGLRTERFDVKRPLNSPQPLSKQHPPIMVGGGGERKTLRLVARYAQACNLFPTSDLARKLQVLREHCESEGRDYDEISKTVYSPLDVGEKGEKTGEMLATLRRFADLGFDTVIGPVTDAWEITPLEAVGRDVIPAVTEW